MTLIPCLLVTLNVVVILTRAFLVVPPLYYISDRFVFGP
jgi:hypothetical protein